MQTWVAFLSAVAGGAIALAGQYLTRRLENRSRGGELLLELCATVVALNEDFRNRLWEERRLGQTGRVDGWDLAGTRLAEARLRIVARDQRLLDALDEVTTSGGSLGSYWRRGQLEEGELQRRSDRNKDAIAAFLRVARDVVGASFNI
ncbi:MAG TPA: hypothetical protein VI248_23715 [Kineosporiaceae bacterium]